MSETQLSLLTVLLLLYVAFAYQLGFLLLLLLLSQLRLAQLITCRNLLAFLLAALYRYIFLNN
jgi:hypothetical protein